MSDKITKSPQFRFAGFINDWEQRKLDSIVDRVKSYSLSRDVETIEDTGYKYIHYGDIHTKVANVIDESSNLPNIKAGNYELLEKGDLVVADASEDYQGIATPAVITVDSPYKIVSGLHTIALRPKQLDSMFLYYLINSPTFRKYGYKTGTGMKVFGISATNLLKFEGWFPVLEEQTKIGNFFKQLDETISLLQRKLELLKDTKESLLHKMFPKDGADVPEIRFAGFTDAWEQQKLSEVMSDFIVPMRDKPKEFSGDIPWTRIEDIEGKYLNGSLSGQYVSEETIKKMNLKIIPKGSLIVSASATFGVVAVVTQDLITNQTFIGLVPGIDFDLDFLYTFFHSPTVQRKMKLESAGSTIFYISRQTFEDMKFPFPEYAEQKKVGQFFNNLDHLITLHQDELKSLENLKKLLLQQMFVYEKEITQ
ncbi:restriction endonuclease subunit S [Chungangia koreensis]|uniref:Restriction endonuclease subunit S n=1 Tax=Chungangia koreensis TaxID=752657 RepID=A0ABV8X1P0_9LACT